MEKTTETQENSNSTTQEEQQYSSGDYIDTLEDELNEGNDQIKEQKPAADDEKPIQIIQPKGQTENRYGCQHYKRRCQKRCPECLEFFSCRVCHDEAKYHNEWDVKKAHKLNRFAVKEIRCNECHHVQKPQKNCEKCNIEFAGYFCDKCCLFDDDYEKKEIFHCDGCGICRCGGRDKSFHCEKCECCIDIKYQHDHTCVSLKSDCPVCMQDMHDTRLDVTVPKCGHGMHLECLQQYLKTQIGCPICKKSLVNPKIFEAHIDLQIAETIMPVEYRDTKMIILCNDCLTKSCVKFHVIGGKCKKCKSYNTSRLEDSDANIKDLLAEEENEDKNQNIENTNENDNNVANN